MIDFERYRNTVKTGRDTRLLNEWEMLDEACAASEEISYSVCKTNASDLPVVYEIIFHIKSITGVNEADERGLKKPVFGDKHILHICLPNNYPAAAPEFKFVSDVWHPNVRYFGEFKGRVCLNFNDCGTTIYIAEHIATISRYLRYTDYHARNIHPYPEDRTVAQWIIEQAEPMGWTRFMGN